MRLGASFDGETLGKTVVIDTPVSYEAGVEQIKRAGVALTEGEPVLAIAGGIAGPYSQKKSVLLNSPNLRNWIGKPFKTELEKFFNAPVYIENDAALAGLGEALRGAGRDFDIVAYMTVSTGIGGAKIVSGRIGSKSIGFEPGHQIIDADRTIIPDVDGEFFQNYISGKSVAKRTGKSPKDITEPAFWDGFAKILAYGLNNVCVFWSPDVIVLGGSMITGNPAIPIEKTRKHLNELMKIYTEVPPLKMAELQDFGGLHGALEYIKQQTVQPI